MPTARVNDYLLKVKQPMLCIQCHNGFAGGGMGNAHAARDRYAFNQSCMNCHPTIHGSMHPHGQSVQALGKRRQQHDHP